MALFSRGVRGLGAAAAVTMVVAVAAPRARPAAAAPADEKAEPVAAGAAKADAKSGAKSGALAPEAWPGTWPRQGPPRLVWTGFRAVAGGGAEVRLQISAEVALEPRAGGDGVAIFFLPRCRTLRRNHQLPLETQFFDSPVTRVAVRERPAGVEIAVHLRRPTEPSSRREPGPNGSSFWVLAFPGAKAHAENQAK